MYPWESNTKPCFFFKTDTRTKSYLLIQQEVLYKLQQCRQYRSDAGIGIGLPAYIYLLLYT